PSELAGVREFRARNVHRITSFAQRHPGALGVTSRTPLTVGAGPDEQVYHLIMHASPHTVSVPQEDGSTYQASGEELTRWLSRRPSVRRLRDQDWIYLDACWTG
ncbi:hypothetical protein NGM37_33930, partial [Streptomyces sp. TRM76130]|nr:hypothetical protein [Streptomyces sp. TRM76130]